MSWKEDLVAGAKKAIEEQVLPAVEVAIKKEVEAKSDAVVDGIFAKIEELTPGWFDSLLESQKPQAKALIKAELLKLADQISDKV